MKIQQATALVTGDNRGLGRAIVESLLERGARRVYAAARQESSLQWFQKYGTRVIPIVLDVTSEQQVIAATKAAADIDLLINNAGSLFSFGVLAPDADAIRRDFETNFFGVLRLARAFAPVLEATTGAAMANVLSVASLSNMPALGGYSTSKAAAWSLTQALRAELAPRNIQTFAVFPGPIDTDMIRGFEMPKTSAADVARAMCDGIEASTLDIYPDAMSKTVGALFAKDPGAVAKQFTSQT